MTDNEGEGVTCTPETPAEGGRLYPLSDLLGEWAADAEAAHEAHATGTPRGPVTGFPTLDHELGGYLVPGLHVLAGEPGKGKTALALQIAATCGAPALFVTTEMGPLELLKRITARVTGTFLRCLKSGELTPAASLALAERAAAACPMLALYDATRGFVAPWQVEGQAPGILEVAEAWRERCQGASILVVVDSLHTWSARDPRAEKWSEYERLTNAVNELASVGLTLKGPVLAIAEQNRPGQGSDKQNTAKGTGRFEYAGETIFAYSPDGEWRQDSAGEHRAVLTIAKSRNGPAGPKVKLAFHGRLQAFREA